MVWPISGFLGNAWRSWSEKPVRVNLLNIGLQAKYILSLRSTVGNYIDGSEKGLFTSVVDKDGHARQCFLLQINTSQPLEIENSQGEVSYYPARRSIFSGPARLLVVGESEASNMRVMAPSDVDVCFESEKLSNLTCVVINPDGLLARVMEPNSVHSSGIKADHRSHPQGFWPM